MSTLSRMIWSAADLQNATGGQLLSGDPESRFSGIGIDSRTLPAGALFVAIVGGIHDGHRFVEPVIGKGCAGVLIDFKHAPRMPMSEWRKAGILCLAVVDTTRALGDLATFHRKRSGASVVAVTGSNGKTSTREMTAAVLEQHFNVLVSLKNFNNEIGVPLTLLRLTSEHRWVVAELGMNHPGEIRRLGRICRPDVGVITNIGPAHLEGVGSLDGVMAAKGELLETLSPDGVAVLNADDSRCRLLAGRTRRAVLFYGLSDDAHVRAEAIREQGRGIIFSLILPDATVEVELQTPGRFMVLNALAAAAVGYRLGVPVEKIKAGLERFRPVDGRAGIVDTVMGIHVIDDTYNANPGSMAAGIAMLKALAKGARCFFAMGDMRELGPDAAALHREIGKLSADMGVFRVAATGDFAGFVTEGARSGGMPPDRFVTGGQAEIFADFKQSLSPGDWVLVKGSRSMGMEKLVKELVDWAGGPVYPAEDKD
ncbi:MAG: UDP-N-acetylmuramoyl-tripeptide--D-alanyl-D-alanine ligase [Pseudomonadota bacterium]